MIVGQLLEVLESPVTLLLAVAAGLLAGAPMILAGYKLGQRSMQQLTEPEDEGESDGPAPAKTDAQPIPATAHGSNSPADGPFASLFYACAKCGSFRLELSGSERASVIDGKVGMRCLSCGLRMAPFRRGLTRAALWGVPTAIILLSVGIALFCVPFLGRGGVPLPLLLALPGGVFSGAVGLGVGIRELGRPMPVLKALDETRENPGG